MLCLPSQVIRGMLEHVGQSSGDEPCIVTLSHESPQRLSPRPPAGQVDSRLPSTNMILKHLFNARLVEDPLRL